MLSTIQELEREIDWFHKNVKESNELMEILTSVVALTKTQTESFETSTKSLQDEMQKKNVEVLERIQRQYAESLAETNKEFSEQLRSVAEKLQSIPGQIENAAVKQDSVFMAELSKSNDERMTHMTRVENQVAELSRQLEIKYEEYSKSLRTQTESFEVCAKSFQDEMQKKNVETLERIQRQYADSLAETHKGFSEQLRSVSEKLQSIPEQIENVAVQQDKTFMTELNENNAERMAYMAQVENRVVELSRQLENKYDRFIDRLESTNVDQLHKICLDMNKSLNTKLAIVLSSVAVAVVVSIISLFI